MLKYTKFRIHSGQKDENGVTRRADIRQIESNMSTSECNELPLILNALVGSIDLEGMHRGFPYTFTIKLEDDMSRHKFTYLLPLIFK